MQLINLQQYSPEEKILGENVLYFIDEGGMDWYESQALFTRRYKLLINTSDGVIRSIDTDASRLFPEGMSVVEVDELPEGCTPDNAAAGAWLFDGNEVKAVPEQVLMAQRKPPLVELTTAAFALQILIDNGTATKEQIKKSKEIKNQIVNIMTNSEK